jgi:hypothetical protein
MIATGHGADAVQEAPAEGQGVHGGEEQGAEAGAARREGGQHGDAPSPPLGGEPLGEHHHAGRCGRRIATAPTAGTGSRGAGDVTA